MTYLGSDRFVVRELEGYTAHPDGRTTAGNAVPGLTVTVIDRAYCGQVLRMWRTEDKGMGSISRGLRRLKIRGEAETYAANLNAGGRCTGGPLPGDTLLTPETVLPSLSPFDSGCPQ